MSRRKGTVPHIRPEERTPEMRPKVRMVFFMGRLLWGDLETLCKLEAVFVVMLSGDFGGEWGKSCFGMTV
jgi:hypothetical protein